MKGFGDAQASNVVRGARDDPGTADAFGGSRGTAAVGYVLRVRFRVSRAIVARLEPQYSAVRLVCADIEIAVRRRAHVADAPLQIVQ